MPYVLIDYSKCNGDGACETSCPSSAFERIGNWCKPRNSLVKNDLALQFFFEHILSNIPPVPVTIRYHVPECYLCWQCVGACPKHAIDIEYDDLDLREFLLPSTQETPLQVTRQSK